MTLYIEDKEDKERAIKALIMLHKALGLNRSRGLPETKIQSYENLWNGLCAVLLPEEDWPDPEILC